MQLSWDLHVHPGPSSVPRWGTGTDVRAAAARAGLRGFVWKSHEMHTARAARDLGPGAVRVIGSASLNAWAGLADVEGALADGARWLWGPSRGPSLDVAWDLSLPSWWPALAHQLADRRTPLLLATGHLGPVGRLAFAELAAASEALVCSITHAASLATDEVARLQRWGCVFEVDLYTGSHLVPGRPQVALAPAVGHLLAAGAPVYLTTDAGQPATGDPYRFASTVLDSLVTELGERDVRRMAVELPERLAAHALADEPRAGGPSRDSLIGSGIAVDGGSETVA